MRPLLLLLALLFFTACGSTRKQLDRASAYEREAMQQEAYDAYAALFDRRPKEAQARIGMQRTAQKLFEQLQSKATMAYALGDLASGDRVRLEAQAFAGRMDRVGLEMQWDPLFDGLRQEAVRTEAQRLYATAEQAYRDDRFTEAEELAGQCARLDPTRRDADHLARLARLEPIYREGVRAQELGMWRDAYRKFAQVASEDAAHKDCVTRLNTCKGKAAYTITYMPLHNRMLFADAIGLTETARQIEAQFAANVKQEVLGLNDPLIIMVDRDNTDQLLAEQQRQMSAVYDDRYVAEAGKLLGARYVLTGKILRFDDVLRKEIEVQMQLLDAESGRVHVAEIVRVNKQEIARGGPRAQLLERAAKRMALKLAEFDPARD